ncbi:bifunctional precorrin-2 dehydrogenase/sirohydrochlorin ferrochelatase [Brevibacillus humidisoli]|uniref:precorrin-2 dehydrogenase/sirohydrochlorin ferrochelatase family protein n=1 Tax=Brevibacillus humidisoli TaxID=2895522 RepID=UPI001E5CCDC3|nr:bifunctional precorrin-2 dehydrogenase/sirohydrochlorin ferrochelatase [Brevibacillus humidisoli]UFJ39076.1 bifunctional precorrin-2 dehydrogenase/sirohydrochlorin ferrochelatase [Brevibacillus humidisoli]
MRKQYPLMLDLTKRTCLVVGAGEVAVRKIESLLAAGAAVTVISPEADPQVVEWAAQGQLQWHQTTYNGQDVRSYALVIAATDRPDVNLAVHRAVTDCGGWINVVDRPDLCTFTVPSVVRRGKLAIAVSTSGASPSLARKIKQRLEGEFGTEYTGYVDFLAEMRQRVLAQVDDPGVRKQIFRRLLGDVYLHASDEHRYRMAEALLAEAQTDDGGQGGNDDETVESWKPQKQAGAYADKLGH